MRIETLLKTLTPQQVQLLVHDVEPSVTIMDVELSESITDAQCYIFNVCLPRGKTTPGSIFIRIVGNNLMSTVQY